MTLACVKEVADFHVVMSLPCGLQGFLQIRNICDAYTELLSKQLNARGTEVGLLFLNLKSSGKVVVACRLCTLALLHNYSA